MGLAILIFLLMVVVGIFYVSSMIYYKLGVSKEVVISEIINKKMEIVPFIMSSMHGYELSSINDNKMVYFVEIKGYNELVAVSEEVFKSLYIGEKIDLIIRTEHYALNIPFMKTKFSDHKSYEVRRSTSGHY